MESIVGLGVQVLFLGVVSYLVLRLALHYPLRKCFGIKNESFILKDLHIILIGIAAIITATLAIAAYDKLQQSLNISLNVEQVTSNKSEEKTGLVITLSVTNNGLSQAIIRTASNQRLLKVSKINYEKDDPENLYSTEDYYPYYFYSIGLLENNKITKPSETVYERSISRGVTKNISFYVEVDSGHTYHVSSLLDRKNLFFKNQLIDEKISNLNPFTKDPERTESDSTFFESTYIYVRSKKDISQPKSSK